MSTSSNTSVTPPRPKFLDPTGGSSMPPGNSLQDLLTHHGVTDDLDAPEPMSATANPTVSPHRFLTSAALHEYEPRSRPNFSVHDEEGCIDISAPVIAIDTCPTGIGQSFRLLHSPSSMPAMPSFPDSVAEPSGSTLQVPPADMPNGASFIFSGDEEKDFEKNLELIVRRLREAVHLSVLPRQELEFLAHHLDISTPPKGTVVLPFGTVCKGVYVVLRGRVAVFKPDAVVPDKFVSQWWLQRGDIFGFDSIVLRAQSARRYEVMTDDAVIGFFNYSVFFQLVTRNPRMSHSVARKMCEDMNTFKVFKEYARAVFAPTIDPAAGVVVWSKVLEKFGKINNGIYPDMHANRLDTGAWMYALRRLPDNITRSLVIELAKAPPPMMASHMRRLSAAYDRNPATLPSTTDGRITYVGCSVRRRPSFQLGHGKTLVILRDSTTDLLDFTSCMCVHLNESEKLRSRLFNMTDPGLIPLMERCIESSDIDEIRETLKKLPFDEDEAKGLIKLWGKDTMRNMFDIVTTRRDDLQVRVDLRSYRRFYRTPSSIFAANIRHTILQRLGLPEDGDLPPNLVVDIISSNAHGIKNSFSYFPRKHAAAILKYASEKMGDVVQMNWHNRDDLVYYCASKYLDAHEEARHEFTASLRKSGISVLEETSMTGLEVDVIDLRDIDAAHVDGFLADAARHAKDRLSSPFAAPHYIINMDFPFGSQAESVMKSLAHTFGHHIRSMNIMGKGGGIVGKRGDIQFPTHVLFSKSSVPFDDFVDELRPCGQHDLDLEKMRAMVGSDREVHQGPVLTIAGTMCQNSKLLRMYKHLWGCIGMEMEGSYFDRALGEAMQQGVLRHDLKTRFLYYTSDTPLASEKESLAAGMTPTEGVPPLYAITRVFLDCILRDNTR